MNNIFPLDQDNIWNVYGSTAPPNVSLQSPSSMPNNLNMGNQLNLCQISNEESLRSQIFQSQLYTQEASPVHTPLPPQRDATPQGSSTRFDKGQVFDFSIQQHPEQSIGNRKSWNNNLNFAQMKSPLDVNSPDLSPANNNHFMNIPSSNSMLDDFGKNLMDNIMIDPSTGQILPIRCPDIGKYDMMQKPLQQLQQEQLPQQMQYRNQQQQQDSRYSYTSNKQIQMATQQQKQQQNFQQSQHPQQSLQQQTTQQQRQRQIPRPTSSKVASKKQQLQKDKHQKSNIKSVFSNIAGKDGKRLEGTDSRYNNTLNALKQAGLLDITMQTGDLLKKSNSLQKDIDMLEEIVKVTKHLMTSEET